VSLTSVLLLIEPCALLWQAEAYIDDNLRTIAKAHRAAARRRSSSSTNTATSSSTVPATLLQSGDQPFPEELSRLIHLLYHLRRGPLLGRMLQSADESQRLRTLFLRGDVQRCVGMMAPTLLSATVDTSVLTAAAEAAAAVQQQHSEGVHAAATTAHTDAHNSSSSSSHTEHNGVKSVQHCASTAQSESESSAALQLHLEQVPPETLRLLKDSVLLLDTYDSVYVWIGRAVPAATAAAVRAASLQQVQRMTAERFPAPRVLCVADGSSFARFVTCRLAPSHRDPPVGSESSAVRQLRELLPYTDDLSYREYFYSIVAGR
jgi:Gelsolin repeat